MAKIKAVLWDIDGTLLDFLAAERAALRTCFSHFALGECTDEMIAEYSAINLRWWEALERGEVTKPEVVVGRFAEFFVSRGIDDAVAPAFNAEYQRRLGDTIVFCPNAMETILALRGHVTQCAVTNGTKLAQSIKLERSGLDRLLRPIFISDDIGAVKPSAAFFDAVFAALDAIAPEEMLIVGDSLTSDMRGGINAGIQTCWYNPQRLPLPDGLTVNYDIADLAEVLQIVERTHT